MPGGDGTGPVGRGPMTGRAAGFCAGSQTPGFTNPGGIGYGRGLGFGRSRGRGFRREYLGRSRGFWWRGYSPEQYYPPAPSRDEEKTYLENMVKELEEEIDVLRNRINELSKEKKESP